MLAPFFDSLVAKNVASALPDRTLFSVSQVGSEPYDSAQPLRPFALDVTSRLWGAGIGDIPCSDATLAEVGHDARRHVRAMFNQTVGVVKWLSASCWTTSDHPIINQMAAYLEEPSSFVGSVNSLSLSTTPFRRLGATSLDHTKVW
jgi:hypothetical protein